MINYQVTPIEFALLERMLQKEDEEYYVEQF